MLRLGLPLSLLHAQQRGSTRSPLTMRKGTILSTKKTRRVMLVIGVCFGFICFLFSFVSRKRKAESKKTKSVFIDDEASEDNEDGSEVDQESVPESVASEAAEVVYRCVVS
jgi:hypothetical protein